jgi:hypothetical protein
MNKFELSQNKNEMKKNILSLILFFCLISIVSCNDNSKLNQKIQKLELENRKLKSIVKNNDYNKVVSSQLILIPQSLSFKLNKPNTISGILCEQQDFPKFDIYIADENYKFDATDKVVVKKQNGYQFEFDYTPKTLKDETVRIVAVFNLDTVKANLNGRADLPVK